MIGRQIGNYRIEREILGGGMGRVFEAVQLTLNRTVAIKVLRQELAESADQVERFRREADTLARLDHESIVRIIDVLEHEGQHWIIMEFVGGPPLGELMSRAGRLPPPFARDVAADIAGALAAAHGRGIIHRDIKPGNILFTTAGRPKLADFGIARIVDAATGTQSQLVGTPFYMSPEQVRGDVLTPMSDVYSLGVVLYEMLSGRVPFHADSPIGVALKHVQEAPAPLRSLVPELPAGLGEVVDQALEKDPRRRPGDADAFQEALQRLDLGVAPGRALRRLFPGLAAGTGGLECRHCGTALQPGFLTCPRCGRSVGMPSVPSAPGSVGPAAAGGTVAAPRADAGSGGRARPERVAAMQRLQEFFQRRLNGRGQAGASGGKAVRPEPVVLTALGVAALAAAGATLMMAGASDEAAQGPLDADTVVVAHLPEPEPSRPEVTLPAGAVALGSVVRPPGGLTPSGGSITYLPDPEPAAEAPRSRPEPASRPPARETRPPERPAAANTAATPREEPAQPPEPAHEASREEARETTGPAGGFDEASAAREIHGIIDRQRRATEAGDLTLLLRDLGSGLHRDATRSFRGMHRDASDVSSQITNRVVRFSDPDNAQVSFHAVITATRRGDGQRITVADRVVVWRLTRTDGRWLIVSTS